MTRHNRALSADNTTTSKQAPPSFRSGAVARLVGMPVATLRVWERRYGLSDPALTASGQRLYSSADVRRLGLLKQLTDRGHAISSLAPLNMNELQAVVATLFNSETSPQRPGAAPATAAIDVAAAAPTAHGAWQVAVLGSGWAERLKQPALLRQVGRPLTLLGVYDTPAQAARGLKRKLPDLLLIEAASLQPGWLADLDAAAPALRHVKKAVLYGFASEAVCAQLDAAGVALLRAPQAQVVLAQWLRGLAHKGTQPEPPGATRASRPISVKSASSSRWSASALAGFAKQASSIACECPQHLAELLVRLSDFETYSTECSSQSATDADLHAYLRQTAANARATFETALERVALHEGLLVPAADAGTGSTETHRHGVQ
jgi:MerR family transcriptional regulator, light-induced transcriptional regulator